MNHLFFSIFHSFFLKPFSFEKPEDGQKTCFLFLSTITPKPSFEETTQKVQYYLDLHEYKKAQDLLDLFQTKDRDQLSLLSSLRLQVDFYLNKGCFSDSFFSLLSDPLILSDNFFIENLSNLKFYFRDKRLFSLLLRKLCPSSWKSLDLFLEKNPKKIRMDTYGEFPFLDQTSDLIHQFRKQFQEHGNDVCPFYELLELPTTPLLFVWTNFPEKKSLYELAHYMKRNFMYLEFKFVFLTKEFISKEKVEEENTLLPFWFIDGIGDRKDWFLNEWIALFWNK